MTEAPEIQRSALADLFATDPLKLTRENRAVIIAKFRENRQSFMLGQKSEKAAKPKAATKSKITGLSLDDLDV